MNLDDSGLYLSLLHSLYPLSHTHTKDISSNVYFHMDTQTAQTYRHKNLSSRFASYNALSAISQFTVNTLRFNSDPQNKCFLTTHNLITGFCQFYHQNKSPLYCFFSSHRCSQSTLLCPTLTHPIHVQRCMPCQHSLVQSPPLLAVFLFLFNLEFSTLAYKNLYN